MEMLPGTLDFLVLRGLTWGPKHGYAVARWIEQASGGSLAVLDGADFVFTMIVLKPIERHGSNPPNNAVRSSAASAKAFAA